MPSWIGAEMSIGSEKIENSTAREPQIDAAPITCRATFRRVGLLVSVQNASEATVALEAGADWIDLKNPAAGSLGRPDITTVKAVSEISSSGSTRSADNRRISTRNPTSAPSGELRDDKPAVRSVALGELAELDDEPDDESCEAVARSFLVSKVGTAKINRFGFAEARLRLEKLASHLGRGKLVAAAYADFERAGGPPPETVLTWAISIEAPFLLVDTFIKDGRGLEAWSSPAALQELSERCREAGMGFVAAGSLRLTDLPWIVPMQPDYVAVRGAVCSGGRSSTLCRHKIAEWLQALASLQSSDPNASPSH